MLTSFKWVFCCFMAKIVLIELFKPLGLCCIKKKTFLNFWFYFSQKFWSMNQVYHCCTQKPTCAEHTCPLQEQLV